MDTSDPDTAVYESPAVVELGEADALTLGNGGSNRDNCGCCYPPYPPEQGGLC